MVKMFRPSCELNASLETTNTQNIHGHKDFGAQQNRPLFCCFVYLWKQNAHSHHACTTHTPYVPCSFMSCAIPQLGLFCANRWTLTDSAAIGRASVPDHEQEGTASEGSLTPTTSSYTRRWTEGSTVPSPLHQGFDYSQFVYSLENFLTEGGSAVQLPGGAR
jgi:hypothetical protein